MPRAGRAITRTRPAMECRYLAFVLCFAASCGGASPDIDAAFREIQVHEASMARAEAEGRNTCDDAESICTIAHQINDADAELRCERARRRCGGEP